MYCSKNILTIVFIIIAASACISNGQFEKQYYLPNKTWAYNDIKKIQFNITDTSKNYNLILSIQHTYNYAFSNVWVNLTTKYPNGNADTNKHIEVPLALLNGTWLGRSAGNMATQEMNIGPDCKALHFAEKGTYTMHLQQDTRVKNLEGINYIGIKIEALQP
jgi:gliding motility-associated lipoprotein GldH